MVSANKILTVSYGTFSCTLEGFEDPFSTMRAIAEYFRDLAADDRYFGAEPPTPDAEMLHRIAEREIHRRVEAKVQANGVVLRASDQPTEEGAKPEIRRVGQTSPAPAAAPKAEAAAPSPAAPAASTVPVAEDVIDDFAQDRVAAKLLRIRAAVAQPAAADSHAEDAAHQAEERARADAEAAERRREEEAESARAQAEAEAKAAEERARAEAEEEERRREEEVESARAQAEAEAEAAEEEAEDKADLLLQSRVLEVSRIRPMDAEPEDEDAGDDFAAPLDTPRPADAIGESAEDEADEETAHPEEDAAPAVAEAKGAEGEEPGAGPDAVATEAEAPQAAFDTEDGADERTADANADADFEADGERDEQQDDKQDLVARVARSVGQTGLSPEDESELLKELAEVESEKPAEAGSGSTLLRQVAVSEEAAMSRLMKQAENELAGPENRRRLSAIEHLRAAVAATRAERQDPGAKASEDREEAALDQYRDDLAEAVRPRRPVAGGGRGASRRPAPPMERIAPLVLVSEQRIDKSDAPARTVRPIRPRRLSSGNLALEDDAEDFGDDVADDANILTSGVSFAEFVKRAGATELTDLIEAAAVYCAQVEGRQNFSRPQLLRKLGELPDSDEISREEGLRGFGRLLREGRFVKIRRGQFAVKDGSRFLPEARRVARG